VEESPIETSSDSEKDQSYQQKQSELKRQNQEISSRINENAHLEAMAKLRDAVNAVHNNKQNPASRPRNWSNSSLKHTLERQDSDKERLQKICDELESQLTHLNSVKKRVDSLSKRLPEGYPFNNKDMIKWS
jgi:hypothetical protein